MTSSCEWEKNRHEYAREWKERTGGKVLGYFCTYVPEEIPYAAGVLPVRILGSHEPQDVTEPHIFGMFCPFCRDCLAQGLKGRYDYLDGIMIAQSCLHIRQAFTSWQKHVPVEYSLLPAACPTACRVARAYAVPRRRARGASSSSIEEWTGTTIADDDAASARSTSTTRTAACCTQVYEPAQGRRRRRSPARRRWRWSSPTRWSTRRSTTGRWRRSWRSFRRGRCDRGDGHPAR